MLSRTGRASISERIRPRSGRDRAAARRDGPECLQARGAAGAERGPNWRSSSKDADGQPEDNQQARLVQ